MQRMDIFKAIEMVSFFFFFTHTHTHTHTLTYYIFEGRHTSMGIHEPNYAGVGMLTEVKAQNRPVTREGLSGIRVKTAGLGRRVQDSSYYLGLVRSKISELNDEIKKMKKEIAQSKKDNNKYVRLEKKYEDLIKEVRELEGTLADYNLAMDKARTNTDPFEITRYQEVLRERNKALEQEVDVIFLQRQKEEARVRKMEAKIAEIRSNVDRRIEMLAPEKLQQYKNLAEEDFVLSRDIEKMRQKIDAMKQNVSKMESRIRHDTWRAEYASTFLLMMLFTHTNSSHTNNISISIRC